MARQALKKDIEEVASKVDAAEGGSGSASAFAEMRDHLESLRAELADLSDQIVELGGEAAEKGARSAKRQGRRAMHQARERFEEVADQSEDLIAQADRFSRERPGLAMGVAAAAGFLLALTMTRR